jgi:hypothetical protein
MGIYLRILASLTLLLLLLLALQLVVQPASSV